MGILILILTLLLSLFLGVETTTTTPEPIIVTEVPPVPGEETFRSPTVIESADALLLESFPVQIHLRVTGYQSDGCDYPVTVEQRRQGSEVYVDIYREMPLAVICPDMLLEYEATIPLDGGFEPGTYRIHVTDQVIEVTI